MKSECALLVGTLAQADHWSQRRQPQKLQFPGSVSKEEIAAQKEKLRRFGIEK